MRKREFRAITADIDKHTEGEGYALDLMLRNSSTFQILGFTWTYLDETTSNAIVLSKSDYPPIYVCIDDIISIRLSRS